MPRSVSGHAGANEKFASHLDAGPNAQGERNGMRMVLLHTRGPPCCNRIPTRAPLAATETERRDPSVRSPNPFSHPPLDPSTHSMKSIIFPERGGAILQETSASIPDPGPGKITVKSVGCGICQVELKKFKGLLDTSFPARFLGHESVGFVHRVGRAVSGLQEGDFVTTLWAPGFDEYFSVRADWAVKLDEPKPKDASLWISEPAACALNGFISAEIKPGDRVLLLGAGYMGLLLTQIGQRSPRSEFVVCDRVPGKLRHALQLGATSVIDGNDLDVAEAAASRPFDIVIEATGAANMIQKSVACCRVGGRVVVFADHRHHRDERVDWPPFVEKAVTLAVSNPGSHPDFPSIWRKSVSLMQAGLIDQSSLISHKWPVAQCAEAMQAAAHPDENYIKGYFSWMENSTL